MSQRNPFRSILLPMAATVAVAMFMVTGLVGAEPSPEAARLDAYSHDDGSTYFALSLQPRVEAPAAEATDIVVLFDTSASQTGEVRGEAMEVLKALLAGLSPEDRVQLMATDLSTVPLSDGFVAPGGPKMAEALQKLDARVPLGTTDVEKALTTAAGSFAAGSKNARAALYIGDGASKANLLSADELASLVTLMADNKIPVSSYAVGPRVDLQLLGVLAGRTGGVLIDEDVTRVATDESGRKLTGITLEQAGAELAAAARATVFWPKPGSVVWPATFEVFPKQTPPLRSDRDTVVFGKYTGKPPFDVQMTVASAAGEKTLSWKIPEATPDPANGYLVKLVEVAKPSGGMTLPLTDRDSLGRLSGEIGIESLNLVQLAKQALKTDDVANAQLLARQALRQNPQDAEAKQVLAEVQGRQPGAGPALGGGEADLNMVGAMGDGLPPGGIRLGDRRRQLALIAQMASADVTTTIGDARTVMSTDPDSAIQKLKLRLESVKRLPDLDPDVRNQLAGQLQAALREADRRQFEVEHQRQRIDENIAKAAEKRRINEALARDQEKLSQLLARFDSLMDERRYDLAYQDAAMAVTEMAPDNPIAPSTIHNSRFAGNVHQNRQLRVLKEKGFIDSLYQNEISHIPFPDDPPIVYPDAEFWRRLTARRKERYSAMDLSSRGPAEKKITEELKSPTTLEFIETPLQDVVDYLKDLHEIEIQLDKRALDDVGLGTDTPITRNLRGISLRSALRLVLRELDLTYVIQDEVLLITTPEQAESRLSTKVYPVADLVLPIRTPMMSGGFGGLGGMSGGMGGMGGGGMGGMGGGGMGGGGMGGGGMGGGGGMFNIPAELLPAAVRGGGFQAFSVKDDLSLAPGEAADKKATEIDPQLQAIHTDEGWNRYFAANKVDPALVRKLVRDLRTNKKYAEMISVIHAALRNNQPQQWMYEALGLAMIAEGRSQDEIERALMSAVDFADSPLEMMYIGIYLSRAGLEKRALSVYRQVAKLAPTALEPYVHGLAIARKLNDLEGIKWTTLGILSQAWPKDQLGIWKTANHVANATVEELREQKRGKEAEEFEKARRKVMVRDVTVWVKWTGDADIDVLVEEPSGTVCSARNPRTTAGGVMLGDTTSARMEQGNADGASEIYVCSQAFPGTYRLLIRRVWGKVTAGRVTVEVIKHYRGGKEQQRAVQLVSLKGDEAVVSFDLKNGRRQESLEQRQVANAAVQQLAVRQQVLTQQLNAAIDPAALYSLVAARARSNNGSNNNTLSLGGAVGYEPVIITLPEGANMTCTGVVSADRRYVRVTCVPLFSQITDVRIFNFVSGEESDGRVPDTGGGGFGGGF